MLVMLLRISEIINYHQRKTGVCRYKLLVFQRWYRLNFQVYSRSVDYANNWVVTCYWSRLDPLTPSLSGCGHLDKDEDRDRALASQGWAMVSRVTRLITSLSRIQSSHAGESFRPKLSQTAAKVLLTIPELYKFLLNFRILAFVFHN